MKFGLFAINYGTCADPDAAVGVARLHPRHAGAVVHGQPPLSRPVRITARRPGTGRLTEALRQAAQENERPRELGRLELTVTPTEKPDRAVVEQYAQLGIDRLVLLPQPDAPRERRHVPVPLHRIMRTIDQTAAELIARV